MTPCESAPRLRTHNVVWTKTKGLEPRHAGRAVRAASGTCPARGTRRRLTDPASPLPPVPLRRQRRGEEVHAARRLCRLGARRTTAAPTCPSPWSGRRAPGKTTLARLFGETVDAAVHRDPAQGVRSCREVFDHDRRRRWNGPSYTDDPTIPSRLKMVKPDPTVTNDPTMHVPPCVVFIDEVHGLPRNMRDGLLKAIEPKDGCSPSRTAGSPTAATSAGSWPRPNGASSSGRSTPASPRSSWRCTAPRRSPPSSSSTTPTGTCRCAAWRRVLPAASPARRWTSPRRWSRSMT